MMDHELSVRVNTKMALQKKSGENLDNDLVDLVSDTLT